MFEDFNIFPLMPKYLAPNTLNEKFHRPSSIAFAASVARHALMTA